MVTRFFTMLALGAASLFAFPSAGEAQKLEIIFDNSFLLQEARKSLIKGNPEKAVGYFERAFERGISDRALYNALNNFCVALYMLEEYELALEQCEMAITVRSNRWIAFNNLGNAYMQLGRYEEAIETYQRGLRLSSDNVMLKRNLDLALRARDGRLPPDSRPDLEDGGYHGAL